MSGQKQEQKQFKAALDLLQNLWLPNAAEHKSDTVVLTWIFEELRAEAAEPQPRLDAKHRQWMYDWAREWWEDVPSRGPAPPLDL